MLFLAECHPADAACLFSTKPFPRLAFFPFKGTIVLYDNASFDDKDEAWYEPALFRQGG